MGGGGGGRPPPPGAPGPDHESPPHTPRGVGVGGFALRTGLTTGTLASYTRKGLMPPPDVIITDGQGGRETRGWTPATIDYWTTHRVGRGYRSDLRRPRTP